MPTTEKVSVTLGREELRGAKRLAAELGLEARARQRAGLEVIATFDAEDRATPEEMQALLARWTDNGPRRAGVRTRPRATKRCRNRP